MEKRVQGMIAERLGNKGFNLTYSHEIADAIVAALSVARRRNPNEIICDLNDLALVLADTAKALQFLIAK